MDQADFAHLHVHSEYSLLDGLSRVKHLVRKTKELSMRHLAITDHGTMYGVIEFYKACKAEGVNPIIGVECYLTEHIDDHTRARKDDYTPPTPIKRGGRVSQEKKEETFFTPQRMERKEPSS